MTSPYVTLASQYAFNDKALDTFSDGFEREHWLHRGDGRSNNALWILGHIAWTRRWMASAFLGADMPSDLDAHFSRGAKPGPDVDAMSAADLRTAFLDAGRVLRERLEALDDDTASAPLPESVRLPDGSRTVGEAVRFLHFHESFHIGQIGLLRRCCGKDGLF